MASLITNTEIIGGNAAARYTWSGVGPYTVYVRGDAVLIGSEATSLVVQHEDGETYTQPVPIEVADSTEDAAGFQQVLHSPRFIMQFRGRRTNVYYVAEFYLGGQWVAGPTIMEDGRGYYQLRGQAIPSGAQLLRITPYDGTGTAGPPVQFSVFSETNPAPPEVTYSYDSGTGDVTVDAV